MKGKSSKGKAGALVRKPVQKPKKGADDKMKIEHSDPVHNGWKRIAKRHGGRAGMYDKYENQIVVIIPVQKNPTTIALTPAAYDELGKPETVELFERGTDVGILNSASITNAQDFYAVSNQRGKKGSGLYQTKLFYISCKAWLSAARLRPGVYSAIMNNGMLIFSVAQTPTPARG